MTRNPLDASGRQHAAGTRPNDASASVGARSNRTMLHIGHSLA
ncbi:MULTISPECIES: hypothetical protein [Burkholderia cepacia complex]|nr:hypothetical protein [Burkholderia cenocepacia]